MVVVAWIFFILAAVLEVAGDAVIRKGLRSDSIAFVATGFVALGCYGIVANSVKWDFSKILGVYVAIFALVSILCGRFVFRESIPVSTWLGLAIIIAGGLVIQFGSHR